MSDLARTAGTSVRSLQAAFADHLGMSPTGYLRRVRLARAHQELHAAEPGDGRSVADIAYQWGFGHVPRFAAAYRERYGVPRRRPCAPDSARLIPARANRLHEPDRGCAQRIARAR